MGSHCYTLFFRHIHTVHGLFADCVSEGPCTHPSPNMIMIMILVWRLSKICQNRSARAKHSLMRLPKIIRKSCWRPSKWFSHLRKYCEIILTGVKIMSKCLAHPANRCENVLTSVKIMSKWFEPSANRCEIILTGVKMIFAMAGTFWHCSCSYKFDSSPKWTVGLCKCWRRNRQNQTTVRETLEKRIKP